jgi:hypothetical protein
LYLDTCASSNKFVVTEEGKELLTVVYSLKILERLGHIDANQSMMIYDAGDIGLWRRILISKVTRNINIAVAKLTARGYSPKNEPEGTFVEDTFVFEGNKLLLTCNLDDGIPYVYLEEEVKARPTLDKSV